MNNNPATPRCLHVPPLRGGYPATIAWESVAGTEGYELDCAWDGNTYETIYQGSGEDSPDIGELYPGTTWRMLEASRKTWRGAPALKWRDMQRISKALTWRMAEADCKTWNAVSTLTWRNMQGNSNVPHKAHTLVIPTAKLTAQFRIRSCKDSDYSEYLCSGICDIGTFDVGLFDAGSPVNVELTASRLRSTDTGRQITVSFDTGKLRFVEAVLCSGMEANTESCNDDGTIVITINKLIPENLEWAGSAALLTFKSLVDGNAVLKMQ